MIIAGLGCRCGIAAADIDAAITAALSQAAASSEMLKLIAIPAAKAVEAVIAVAANARNVPLILIPQHELEAVSERTLTRSMYAMAAMNVNSVAEAAALAAAGAGARLLGKRIAVGAVTCALAWSVS